MTSYFSSKAPRERKVAIAKWPPRYWQGPRAPLFAPSNPKAEDWREAYRRDLETRFSDPARLASCLREIEAATPEPILCCFEADAAECHRRILADFVWERLGIIIPEWEEHRQGSLRLPDLGGMYPDGGKNGR